MIASKKKAIQVLCLGGGTLTVKNNKIKSLLPQLEQAEFSLDVANTTRSKQRQTVAAFSNRSSDSINGGGEILCSVFFTE